jgi:hypothetical protein
MALFQKNPFTAPDIKDIVAEKRSAVQTAMILFGAGIVLVSVLLGGYQIGQWILWNTVPQIVAPALPHETQPLITVESRLRELGGSTTTTAYDVPAVVARTAELESPIVHKDISTKFFGPKAAASSTVTAPPATTTPTLIPMPELARPQTTSTSGPSIEDRLKQLEK